MSSIYSKYEKSTISTFDIIGSYCVGIYYNELYFKAEQWRNEGKYDSLTQAYQKVLYNYIQFTKKKEFFRQTISGIHNYFISTTKHGAMTYKKCIDFIVKEFVPSHLFDNLKETQKYNILNNILIDCLKIFTERILKDQISPIIDNHFEQANIKILQNIYLEIILAQKDKMYAKFINPEKRNHTVPTELYGEIQKQLLKLKENNSYLIKENCELKKEINNIKIISDKEIERFKGLGLQIITHNKQLQAELNLSKNKIIKLENKKSETPNLHHVEMSPSVLSTSYARNPISTSSISATPRPH